MKRDDILFLEKELDSLERDIKNLENAYYRKDINQVEEFWNAMSESQKKIKEVIK